jgi:hypothetical protein
MGLLYKEPEEIKYSCIIKQEAEDSEIVLAFYCDGGKFGCTESLDYYKLSTRRLLDILQLHGEYTEDEL